MVLITPYLNSNSQLQRRRIALPLVPDLIDGQKYFRPSDLPPPSGDDLRALSRADRVKPRAPSLRRQVRLALEMDNAEEKGRAIRRRLDGLGPQQRRERARVLVDGGLSQSDAARKFCASADRRFAGTWPSSIS